MATTVFLLLLILAIGAVGAGCVLAKRAGPVVPFAFIAAYVLAMGASTFISIGVFDMVDPKFRAVWVKYWLDLAWPVETIAFAPSAICALLACWFSRPLTRRDATALLGVYLFLIIFVPIGLKWALDPYIGPGLWFLVGVLALLSTIFFAMAYVKRVAKGEQQDFSALRDNSDP